MAELTPKQSRFVAEYLIDLNATAAYKRSGYKGQGKTAEANASRMLANAKVSENVQSAMNKRSDDLGIDARYVLTTIKETIESCQRLDKPDSSNVLKGCELLGRHLKMFTDKIEATGKDGSALIAPELTIIINGKPKK